MENLFKAPLVECNGEPMDTEEFAKCLEGKTLEEIVHKAKKESERRILAQETSFSTILKRFSLEEDFT
jgi:hypothetical protein